MGRSEIQKLLGGYATGTLTPEEQRALFEAALTDQELFDALAREEALRGVLSDPGARAHLLAVLDEAPAPWYRQWWRPLVVIAAAVVVVMGIAVWERTREPQLLNLAQVERPRFTPPAQPAPAPRSAPLPPPPEVKPAGERRETLAEPLARTRPVLPPQPAAAAKPLAAPAPPPPPPVVGGVLSETAPQRQTMAAPQFRQTDQVQGQQQASNKTEIRLQDLAGNRAPGPFPVAVHGTVTDATGAGIASASVSVKSLTTGETATTSTNGRGEFSVTELPGNTYEISASKPGFQSAARKDVLPVDGSPAAVNLQLQIGPTAETVEVAAEAAPAAENRASLARAGLAAVQASMKKAVAQTAIGYQLLRTDPGIDPVAVPEGGVVPTESPLTLRVTSPVDGFVRITEGRRTLASHGVAAGTAFDATLPRFKRGRVELRVYFSAEAVEAKQQPPSFTIRFTVR